MLFYKSLLVITLFSFVIVGCNVETKSETRNETKNETQVIDDKENSQEEQVESETKINEMPVEIAPNQHLSQSLQSGFLKKSKYDTKIRKEVQRWLPFVDWSIVKAQFYQESKLNPEAESGVGAKGLAQFMEPTWQEMKEDLNLGNVSRTNPDISITAGVYYNSKLWSYWKSERPHYHRVAFMLGSYNAGTGNILKSQKICNRKTNQNCNLWPPVINNLEEITGHHSKETREYTINIFNFYALHKMN